MWIIRIYQRNELSKTLFHLKNNDLDDRIKTKVWEVDGLLTRNNNINVFNPPQPEINE